MLALGGFREGTLTKLRYRHVREDLERDIAPICVRVETEITKGQYGDYCTFIPRETVDYLKLYLDNRRRGSPEGKLPPEEITGDSPLIKDSQSKTPRAIREKQIYRLIHNLFFKAGLLTPNSKRYDLKVHSFRKFFKTQLISRGVPESYAEYFMGHQPDKYGYNDVESRGGRIPEKRLRQRQHADNPGTQDLGSPTLEKDLGNVGERIGFRPR